MNSDHVPIAFWITYIQKPSKAGLKKSSQTIPRCWGDGSRISYFLFFPVSLKGSTLQAFTVCCTIPQGIIVYRTNIANKFSLFCKNYNYILKEINFPSCGALSLGTWLNFQLITIITNTFVLKIVLSLPWDQSWGGLVGRHSPRTEGQSSLSQ